MDEVSKYQFLEIQPCKYLFVFIMKYNQEIKWFSVYIKNTV
jgi:hypothetical protein